MNLKIYSIYDDAAKAYLAPIFVHNDAIALRLFADNVNSQQENNISKHPEQFYMYCLGTWDDITGKIDMYDQPKSMGIGIEFREQKQEETITEKIEELTKLANKIHGLVNLINLKDGVK